MTTLFELADVEVAGLTTPGSPLSAAYLGQRVALVGKWDWLRAHLLGVRELDGGQVRFFGEPGRRAVIEGRVGVSLDDGVFLEDGDAVGLLQLNLRLRGVPAKKTKAYARQHLADLGLQGLDGRRLSTLNLAERFAVQAALAVSGDPKLIVLSAPSFKPEARTFELALIDKLAARTCMLIECDPALHLELIHTADAVAWLIGGRARSVSVQELLSGAARYRVRALGPVEALTAELTQRGAVVDRSPGADELWLSLPDGATTELVLHAALAANTPLTELSPVTLQGQM